MRTIFKYPLRFGPDATCEVEMPAGAQVLRLAMQTNGDTLADRARRTPTLWALVDSDAVPSTRRFAIIGTGHPFPDDHVYHGSFDADPFVWHVVEHRPAGRDAAPAWIPWNGGDCPVASPTVVEYEQRDGQVQEAPAGVLDWNRDDEHPLAWDIMRYRQAADQPDA